MQRTFRICHVDVMDKDLGHDVKEFNPDDKESMKEIVRFIVKKIKGLDKDKKKFSLFGAIKNKKGEMGDYQKIIDADEADKIDVYELEEKLLENDGLIMREHPRMMVAPVPHRA